MITARFKTLIKPGSYITHSRTSLPNCKYSRNIEPLNAPMEAVDDRHGGQTILYSWTAFDPLTFELTNLILSFKVGPRNILQTFIFILFFVNQDELMFWVAEHLYTRQRGDSIKQTYRHTHA